MTAAKPTYSQLLYQGCYNLLSTATASATSKAKNLTYETAQGLKSLAYQLGIEVLNHAPAVLPAALQLATGSDDLAVGLNTAIVVGSAVYTSYKLLNYCYQVCTRNKALVSKETLKTISLNVCQLLVGYSMYNAPSNIYYEDMRINQTFYWKILLVNSIVTGLVLGYQAYSNLKESQLLQKVSPFHTSTGPINWKKVAKSISNTVLGSLSLYGAVKKIESTVLASSTDPKLRGKASLEEVMKHLPGEDPHKVKAFLTLSTKECNTDLEPYGSCDYIKPHSLASEELLDCHKTNLNALQQMMSHSPDLVARIYKLQNQGGKNRFKVFSDFLSGRDGLALYHRRNSLEKFSRMIGRETLEKIVRVFECYDDRLLFRLSRMHLPYRLSDASCFTESELDFIERRRLFDHVSVGKTDTPAVYIEAATDWNGAFKTAFTDQRGYNGERYNAIIQFIRDHKNIYFAQVSSPKHLCESLALASKKLGGRVKHIYMGAHSNSHKMTLDNGSVSGIESSLAVDTVLPTNCFSDSVSEDATWIMMSCNAASSNDLLPNIAQRIAYELPRGGKVLASFDKPSINRVQYGMASEGDMEVSFIDQRASTTGSVKDTTVVFDKSSETYQTPILLLLHSYVKSPIVRLSNWTFKQLGFKS